MHKEGPIPYQHGEGKDPSFDTAWKMSHDTHPDKFASSSVVSQPTLNSESDNSTENDFQNEVLEENFVPGQYDITIDHLPNVYAEVSGGLKESEGDWPCEDLVRIIPDFLSDNPELSGQLYLACDGFQGGRLVAECVGENFPKEFGKILANPKDGVTPAIDATKTQKKTVNPDLNLDESVSKAADEACRLVQQLIIQKVVKEEIVRSYIPDQADRSDLDFGSTMTVVYVNQVKNTAYCIQVGDSPVYGINQFGLVGEITTALAHTDSNGSLMQAFSAWPGDPQPLINKFSLEKISRLIIGSDSLNKGALSDPDRRKRILGSLDLSLKDHVEEIVDLVRDGRDHISVIGVENLPQIQQ